MRAIHKILLAAAVVTAGSGIAVALDSPHNETFNVSGSAVAGSCDTCHKLHQASGGTLTGYGSNDLSCLGCHASGQAIVPFTWTAGQQAVPGTSGVHHSWSVPAVNANIGTATPTNSTYSMGTHLVGGNLQCSTCHNQHGAPNSPNQTYAFNGRYVSMVGATAPSGGAGGTAPTMTPTVAAGTLAAAKGYRLYVSQYTSMASFKVTMSNNWAQGTPTWYKLNTGPAWAVATGPTDTSGTYTWTTASVNLNDGANVSVVFGGTALAAGLYWNFYVGYPFLRGNASVGDMCNDCHKSRDMRYGNVEGTGTIPGTGSAIVLGTTVFSHPVGNTLNANGHGYDRTGAILDVNGNVQPSDGNVTNDLPLSSAGVVTCLSCHNMHGADSNSLTTDTR